MEITQTDLDHVAKLAQLSVPENQREQVTLKISSLLDYMQQLQKADVAGVEPTTHVLPLVNVFRADEIKPGLTLEEALANAPEREQGYFKVPSIL